MPNYSNSIIYKLCCRNTDIEETYIGSTINFSRRKSEHKSVCNNEKKEAHYYPLYVFIRENGGWDNFDMIQIEQFKAVDKRDLHARERYWIELIKPELNKTIPTRTKKESYIANREIILEYVKKYRDDNKDMIKGKRIENYSQNKDKFLEKQKEYYEKNKIKRKEYARLYREKNRESINKKQNNKYLSDANKIIVDELLSQ